MSGYCGLISLDGFLRKSLLAGVATALAAAAFVEAAEQDLDQWIRVPFTGTITTRRVISGTSQIGDLRTEMNETATLTATITRSVKVFNDQGAFVDWGGAGHRR